jgi:hypothetical protein
MQFSAEIWPRSEYIQALGDFSKLIGEKSLIRRQRARMNPMRMHPGTHQTNGWKHVWIYGFLDEEHVHVDDNLLCLRLFQLIQLK